jgi:hypothetical protein
MCELIDVGPAETGPYQRAGDTDESSSIGDGSRSYGERLGCGF